MLASSKRWLLAAAGVTGAVTFAATSGAAELAWQGPATCDRSAFVAEQVESLVGRSLAMIEGWKFEISVEPAPDGNWALTLVTRDTTGTLVGKRRFLERSCVAVTDASAVAMAMTIRSAEEDPPVQKPTEATQPAILGPSPSGPSPAERDRLPSPAPAADGGARAAEMAASLGVVAGSGALPNWGFGAALGFSLRIRSLRLRAEGAWFAPTTDRLSTGRSTEFELATGTLFGCFDRPLTPVVVLGCAGYELGRMSGEGRGVTAPHRKSVLWQAARLETGATVAIAPTFRLVTLAGVALPIDRHDFELDGVRVHRGSLGLRAQLGVELSL
jgi:hypothetical protein